MEAYKEALQHACREGHTDIVKALLAHPKMNLNTRDYNEDTLLHCACRKGHTEVVTAAKIILEFI